MNQLALRLDRTLGPLVVAWIEDNLCHGPGDVQGQRVELDDERVRFILRAYAIDEQGRHVVRESRHPCVPERVRVRRRLDALDSVAAAAVTSSTPTMSGSSR